MYTVYDKLSCLLKKCKLFYAAANYFQNDLTNWDGYGNIYLSVFNLNNCWISKVT